MLVLGKVWKDQKHWLIEVPAMDLMTQGASKKQAFLMLKDAIDSLQNKKSFRVEIEEQKDGKFYLSTKDTKLMISFILLRQRTKQGLSLEDVRKKLGVKSKNAYAQYEQGKAEPTVSKMEELLKALNSSLVLDAA